MSVNKDIEARLNNYAEAFEYYLEKETLPEKLSDDLLGNYMKTVLDDPVNRNLCLHDLTWKELIMTSLLDFFRMMLFQLDELEKERSEEIKYIDNFYRGDINLKRQLWQDIMKHIAEHYSLSEININGYIYLMQHNVYPKDDIFKSMVNDWKEVCNNRIDHKKHACLEKYRKRFEEWTIQAGQNDYKAINKTEEILYKYPQLKEILQIMGREKKQEPEKTDATITRYVPILLSHNTSHEEISGVKTGDDLKMLLPNEMALLSNPATTSTFYRKYLYKQLQSFAYKPPIKKKEKTERNLHNPRLLLGPIIVSVDTSSSMTGKPEKIAKSLLMQILRMAKKKKRKCFLITFSIHTCVLDISKATNWRKVREFMKKSFTGGTCGEFMLNDILKALKTKNYSMADVLIISDFQFDSPLNKTKETIIKEQEKGTCFYGLQIGKGNNVYKTILDKV